MVLMHMCSQLQESELLMSDMKVYRTANAFVVQEIGAPPPLPSTCLLKYSEQSAASNQQDGRVKPLKNPMNSEAMSIFLSLNS